jgi:predicted Ser/Thr protein kinase
MENIKLALQHLDKIISEQDQRAPISFQDFIKIMSVRPSRVLRNVFQVFHDMMTAYVGEGVDEYPDDPESINFINYDCSKLFVEGADHPFFADRLFANRLINQVDALKRGAQQNKIYIFDGPPGCGKSTFLNNLLKKFEEYTNTEEGFRYETVWRLVAKDLGGFVESENIPVMDRMLQLLSRSPQNILDPSSCEADQPSEQEEKKFLDEYPSGYLSEEFVEVPCPSHDHPILMIPKNHRRGFLDDLFQNDEFKWNLFTEKEYEWVFHDNPCTICSSLYDALLKKLKSPLRVFEMIYARPYQFNRRLGEGITVFNPGDRPMRQNVLTNPMLQTRINSLLKDSNQARYIYSQYAKTNNGIYALMDIKSHNIERLIELHNIISEAVHKVEDIEENVNSLFIALMNPEDKKNIQDFQSFSDRIAYINIPYVLDLQTEVNIYRNIFGKHIDECFLPRVLHNFARVIISSRIKTRSDALLEWIGSPEKYRLYCDDNLQLLKMEIYTGYIPPWLTEEDRKRFTAQRRRKIIAESEFEGIIGFSGRDAIKIFNEFYSTCSKEDSLINMNALNNYFTNVRKDLARSIPSGFLDSLIHMYNYTVLQEVKESLYYFNEDQISKDIQNYMFAVNFEPETTEICAYTGERIEITEDFFRSIENHLLGARTVQARHLSFRKEVQKEYASRTLTQEILMEEKPITKTVLFEDLHERYVFSLKEKVLDPFVNNKNFRMAIKDYGSDDFKTYDKRIRNDVAFLIGNLCSKYRYTQQGAKEVCIYVIDNELPKKFADTAG